jgi:predicted nucleic acid-binding protein
VSIVVSDTSPVRALVHLDRVRLLTDLFREVLIPPAVLAELQQPTSRLPAISDEALALIRVQAPMDTERVAEFRERLDLGESEALVLALEVVADALLIDEAVGRKAARDLGLRTMGVLGVLLQAKQRHLVPALAPFLDRLQFELGFYISAPLRQRVLREAGEQPGATDDDALT